MKLWQFFLFLTVLLWIVANTEKIPIVELVMDGAAVISISAAGIALAKFPNK